MLQTIFKVGTELIGKNHVNRKCQGNAWMNKNVFEEWFFQQFAPHVEFFKLKHLPRQADLILANATTHPNAQYIQDKEIKAIYLPPNVTSLIQPMDQGVLPALKKRYRLKLLSSSILALEEINDLVAKLNMSSFRTRRGK